MAPRATNEVTSLRLATAGSVDDGKSTLIGRLLFDSKAVLVDQLEQVEDASRRRHGEGTVDLSLLTDGLRAEREQGITIDVAYRYFATARRRFILADTPGHVQYTRNMVTGASTADLAIVLVDARKGVLEQTKRHAHLSSLLGIRHIVVAVNKMDLVDFDEEVFDRIVCDFHAFADGLELDVVYIPISAKDGDNVVDRLEPNAVVPGAGAARASRDRRGRVRSQPDRSAASRPVGDPGRRGRCRGPRSRLPRLRRADRLGRRPRRRRGARAPGRQDAARSRRSTPMTARSTKHSCRCR